MTTMTKNIYVNDFNGGWAFYGTDAVGETDHIFNGDFGAYSHYGDEIVIDGISVQWLGTAADICRPVIYPRWGQSTILIFLDQIVAPATYIDGHWNQLNITCSKVRDSPLVAWTTPAIPAPGYFRASVWGRFLTKQGGLPAQTLPVSIEGYKWPLVRR